VVIGKKTGMLELYSKVKGQAVLGQLYGGAV